MTREKITHWISAIFICLFVYAAVSKLIDFQKFKVQLGQSPMLTDMAKYIAWFIPATELFISALLIFYRTRLVGLYASFSLMVMFTVYIILASRFSDYVPCSCGGIIQNLTWTEHLIFNMILIMCGLCAIVIYPSQGLSRTSTQT